MYFNKGKKAHSGRPKVLINSKVEISATIQSSLWSRNTSNAMNVKAPARGAECEQLDAIWSADRATLFSSVFVERKMVVK